MKLLKKQAIVVMMLTSSSAIAQSLEVTPFVGKLFSDNLISDITDNSLNVTKDKNFGLSFAWQESPNGQGQILLNYSSHDYNSQLDNSIKSFDVLYGHFGGVAQYRQQQYITTVSIGVGGAHFSADEGSTVYPSVTMSVGTKYELSPQMSFVTELRAYGSLVDEDSDVFCKAEVCSATFENALWIDSTVWVGLAYKF